MHEFWHGTRWARFVTLLAVRRMYLVAGTKKDPARGRQVLDLRCTCGGAAILGAEALGRWIAQDGSLVRCRPGGLP
jgi:hypothetical protein